MLRHDDTRDEVRDESLRAGIVAFAIYHLALAAWMAISPHSFYKALGPFEALNRHYIRDTATFTAALGFGFVVAVSRRSWRVPVIAVTTVQFALHTVNHLVDASKAHGGWVGISTGWFDFASLLAATLMLAWMWHAAARRSGTVPAARATASVSTPPLSERSTT